MSSSRSPASSPPGVTIGGKAAAGVRGLQVEDGHTVHAHLDLDPQAAARAVPGAAAEVATEGWPAFRGNVESVTVADTPHGRVVSVELRAAAAALTAPVTHVAQNAKRSEVFAAVLKTAGLTAPAHAGADDVHARVVLLGQPADVVVARLAALGGAIPLFAGDGTVAASDPRVPTDPRPIRSADWSFSAHDTVADLQVRAVAPNPADWAKVHAGTAGKPAAGRRLAVSVPEAASPGELENYAGVVRAVVRAGRPHLHGGSRLAAITPGTWVRPDGAADAWLVTGRRRTWSRDAGWQVELSGGFDPTALLTPTHIPATRGLVVARDAKASRVRVRLPLYDVELSLELVARVAGSDRLDVALPGVGDPVVVQWLEDCPTHGLLTGSPVRPGVMPESEFDAAHAVTRAAGFGHSLGADGRLHQTLASWQFVVQGVCDASAEKFDFKPYRK